jgi:hypothetical protein
MATLNLVNSFLAATYNGVHNFSTADVKVALSNVAPDAADTQLTDITEIATGGGYVAGGYSLDNVESTQTAGVYTLKADNEVITATGAAIATFRYIVVYDGSATNDELVGWVDNGSTIDLSDGESITLTWAPTRTIITHQEAA